MSEIGAGAQQTTTFRKYVSDSMLNRQLEKTRKYSRNVLKNKELFNCVNLTVLLLGLIEKEEKYLEICLNRDRITLWHELDLITHAVCKKAGIKYLGREYTGTGTTLEGENSNMTMTDITEEFPFTTQIVNIGETLPNSYATPLGVVLGNGLIHLVVLRKSDSGLLEIIDPQATGFDKSYPLRYIVNGSVDCNPFKHAVLKVIHFEGPSIDPKHLRLAKSNIANIVMAEEPVYVPPAPIVAPETNSDLSSAARILLALGVPSTAPKPLFSSILGSPAKSGEGLSIFARAGLSNPNKSSSLRVLLPSSRPVVLPQNQISKAPRSALDILRNMGAAPSALSTKNHSLRLQQSIFGNILRSSSPKSSNETKKKNNNTNKKPQEGGKRRGTRKHRS